MDCYHLQLKKNYLHGIITGLDKNKVQVKLDCFHDSIEFKNSLLLFREVDKMIKHSLAAQVMLRENAYYNQVNKFFQKPNILFSALIDGTRKHLYLNDSMICGVNTDISIDEFKKEHPDCISKNQFGCKDPLIFSNQIKTECIFLNSCSSSLVSTSKNGMYINVAMNLLINTKSLISGYRPKEGHSEENLLYFLLAERGYSFGGILYILNLNSYNHYTEVAPYILFGNPLAVPTKLKSISTIAPEKIQVNNSNITIQIEGDSDQYQEFTLSLEKQSDLFEKIYDRQFNVKVKEVLNQKINYSIIPYKKDKKVKFIIYAWDKIQQSFKVHINIDKEEKEIKKYKERYRNLLQLKTLGFRHEKLRNQITEYLHQINKLIPFKDRSKNTLQNAHIFRKYDTLARIEDNILNHIRKRTLNKTVNFFIEEYREEVFVISADSTLHKEIKCPYCGGNLGLKVCENSLYDIRRLSAFCSLCHNVFDVPFNDANNLKIYPKIEVVNKRQQSLEFTATIKNMKEWKTVNLLCFALWGERRSDVEKVERLPLSEKLILNPEEEKKLTFQAKLKPVSEPISKPYCVYLYWFADFITLFKYLPFLFE
ncbi:hypothetical protein ES707_15998 [subsurface metagenome]